MTTISEDGWVEWHGGKCPVPGGMLVDVMLKRGPSSTGYASAYEWSTPFDREAFDHIVAYRIAKKATEQPKANGGKLSGDHYYRVSVSKPIAPDVQPYVAECADIIEALNMTFNEGEAFKAIWRLAASRQGRVKPGSAGMQYDADKVAHYGVRVAEHTRSQQ